MKLFKSKQIPELDKITIETEEIRSIDLMERASKAIFHEIINEFDKTCEFVVVVGTGNNGGDGLGIARMLLVEGYKVFVYVCNFANSFSPDRITNLNRLKDNWPDNVKEIESASLLKIKPNVIVIEAVFGSGLTRQVSGEYKKLVEKINESKNTVLAVDIPSGLLGEENPLDNETIVKADITYALEFPSVALMFPENYKYFRMLKIVPFGLSEKAKEIISTNYYLIDKEIVNDKFIVRNRFDHKGNFGHLLMIAGSYGKAGAAVLASKAAIVTGAGLVTSHLPVKLVDIMQTSVPEAMISIDKHEEFCSGVQKLEKYNAIGIGPGLDVKNVTSKMLCQILNSVDIPIVLDADALNILSSIPNFLKILKPGTILTPHPKEFERLFGKFESTWQKMNFMQKISVEKSIIIVLKGGISIISLPNGDLFFNVNGNPGMATGGSGDVLTGVIASLLAQAYIPEDAALLGVYFHSNAGDIAKQKKSEMSLCASDIIDCLSDVFKEFEN